MELGSVDTDVSRIGRLRLCVRAAPAARACAIADFRRSAHRLIHSGHRHIIRCLDFTVGCAGRSTVLCAHDATSFADDGGRTAFGLRTARDGFLVGVSHVGATHDRSPLGGRRFAPRRARTDVATGCLVALQRGALVLAPTRSLWLGASQRRSSYARTLLFFHYRTDVLVTGDRALWPASSRLWKYPDIRRHARRTERALGRAADLGRTSFL